MLAVRAPCPQFLHSDLCPFRATTPPLRNHIPFLWDPLFLPLVAEIHIRFTRLDPPPPLNFPPLSLEVF